MTYGMIGVLALLGLVVAAFVGIILLQRRAAKLSPPQTHTPHKPGAGLDPAAVARSVQMGHGTNGNG